MEDLEQSKKDPKIEGITEDDSKVIETQPKTNQSSEMSVSTWLALVGLSSGVESSQGSGENTKSTSSDMSVSTWLHLAGMPSASEFRLLEAMLERVDSKLNLLTSKLDKISIKLGANSPEGFFDRVDFQLSELREHLKGLGVENIKDISKMELSGSDTSTESSVCYSQHLDSPPKPGE